MHAGAWCRCMPPLPLSPLAFNFQIKKEGKFRTDSISLTCLSLFFYHSHIGVRIFPPYTCFES